jgi:hypothetical protein
MTQINVSRKGKSLNKNHKSKIAAKMKELIWLNNGVNELRQNIAFPIPDGYVFGRLNFNP